MKRLLLGLIISLPVLANVDSKTSSQVNEAEIENPELEKVQMEEDQERGSEIEKQREMEEHLKKDLNETEEDLRSGKDY